MPVSQFDLILTIKAQGGSQAVSQIQQALILEVKKDIRLNTKLLSELNLAPVTPQFLEEIDRLSKKDYLLRYI